jgi:CheY-like chemotaxis protein
MTQRYPLILIVEDNADNRLLIHDILDVLKYDVAEAGDGVEAIAVAGKRQPDLILMDLSLPKKDGWETAHEIKANPLTAHIPIIALTAHAMIGHLEEALKAGCNDYLTKSIHFGELEDKIKTYLSK